MKNIHDPNRPKSGHNSGANPASEERNFLKQNYHLLLNLSYYFFLKLGVFPDNSDFKIKILTLQVFKVTWQPFTSTSLKLRENVSL